MGVGPLIVSLMLTALCERLLEKPDEDLDGMVLFVCDNLANFLRAGRKNSYVITN